MRRPRHSRSPFLALLAAAALTAAAGVSRAAPASAQTVVGTVTERGTARPLPGTFVVLVDASGARQNGVLTDDDGAYRLRAAGPGRYRLVAELIGYASARTEWIELTPGASVRQDIDVPVEAVTLEGIEVETGQRCRRQPGAGPETARLWEEARKALEVTRWSEKEGALRFHVVQHWRNLDARTLRGQEQQERARSGYYDRSPYQSIPAERLDRGGYVQLAPDETYDYFAPDANVLLSESFLETHCFRVVAGRADEPELIGLGFEPVPERTLPDIRGVLWLEKGSAELRRLDYTYQNLPFAHGRWDQVGGRVEFERLATGMWIVRRWHIRMPLEARAVGGFGDGRRELELVRLQEQGAEIRGVTTRDGTLMAEAVGATLYGTVTAGPEGVGLEGATVEVVAAGRRTTTAEDGAYRVADLPSGTYTVRVRHPELDLLGIAGEERDVELVSGRATRVLLDASLTPRRARAVCEAAGWAAASGAAPVVLYGLVREEDGTTPAADAVLRLWSDAAERRVAADSAGAYRLCLEPSPQTLRLAAVDPADLRAATNRLQIVEPDLRQPGFVRVDVPLSTPARAPATGAERSGTRASSWSNAIVGRVLDAATRQPVEGALVTLADTAGATVGSIVTDASGAFKLLRPAAAGAVFRLNVGHVAYGAVESDLRFLEGEELRVEVLVSNEAIPLEPIVVTERRRDFLADQGFYRRLERGRGLFIQREEIERRKPSRITDLLQGRSGLQVVGSGTRSDVRPTQVVGLRGDRMSCQPAVWIDGTQVRRGGQQGEREGPSTGAQLPKPPELALSDLVSPDDVEAMEVYMSPATLPLQYGGSEAACGVIVIWTRRS